MKKINIAIVIFLLAGLPGYSQGDWSFKELTTFKLGMGTAQVGSEIYFGGGYTTAGVTDLVEVYDMASEEWTYLNLSEARSLAATVSNGSKVFFAGGMDPGGVVFNTIDIFDTQTQDWSVAQRSVAGFYLSAVSLGSKVLFAGGMDFTSNSETNIVDIYDLETGMWTTDFLSEARAVMGAAIVGDLALFAGGLIPSSQTVTERVDIYNLTTGEWTTERLSEARFGIAATTIGNKIFFAGGELDDGTLSNRIDIYDSDSNTWSIDSLSVARSFVGAATVCGKAYFVGGMRVIIETGQTIEDFNVIDIYDEATDSWSVEYLPYNLFSHSTISTGDKLFISGGGSIVGSFIQLHKEVRIFTCTAVGTDEWISNDNVIAVFPNPVIGNFFIVFAEEPGKAKVKILDMAGTIVYQNTYDGSNSIEMSTTGFSEGVYIVQVQTPDFLSAQKILVLR